MLESRNLASYTYNEEIASGIETGIRDSYFKLMKALGIRLQTEP